MKEKLPGLFSLLAIISQLAMWGVYLFVAQPDGQLISGAYNQIVFSFDPKEEAFVRFTLMAVSLIACVFCSILFLFTSYLKVAMVIVAIHASLILYSTNFELALMIALPLFFAHDVFKSHNKAQQK
jgi:hypothetical protein